MPVHSERYDGGVVRLRLDNPGRRNALDLATASALSEAAGALAQDRSARCVVVTGTAGSFCSGADLGAMRAERSGTLARRELLQGYYRAFLDIRDLPMPVLAAVNGPAVGAGLNLALCCDLRIAARSARFGATFVRLGIHPGGGVSSLLTRLVGPARAAELVLGAELIGADQAYALGLVNRVADDAQLEGEALAWARKIALGAPAVTRMAKRTLRLAADADFDATLELESLAQGASQETEEAGEGWAAFRERRPPRFPDA